MFKRILSGLFQYAKLVQYCININCNAGCLGRMKNYFQFSTHHEIVPNTSQNKHFCCQNAQNYLVKQEGLLSFQHPRRATKAVVHLQAKPSCLWGSTMCRGALSVWGHFSSLGFCYALSGGGFSSLFLC